jgi:hypothetical protein
LDICIKVNENPNFWYYFIDHNFTILIYNYYVMQGYHILAESLAKQNVKNCYGIVGIWGDYLGVPVI